ncbi:MAG: MucR family transcriptional regulator, partial [Hyphomonadaceae bacterium]
RQLCDERCAGGLAVTACYTTKWDVTYIICLEDGKKLKMLKRYLRSKYNLSPEEYRRRWNLPADYPMVAPNYAKRRSEFARQIGLGRGVRGR